MSNPLEEKDIYGALTLYREMSLFLCRREDYERALAYFEEALQRGPTDKRTLIGRSMARAKVCQYKGALEDIQTTLTEDPQDLIANAHKALNTYLSCEFEDALVFNTRMVPKRKKPDHFTMGVMTCTEAIENGLGTRSGHPLRDHFKIIRKLAWRKNHDAEKPFDPKLKSKKKKKKKSTKKVVKEPVIPFSRTKQAMKKTGGKKGGPPGGEAEDALDILDSLHSFKSESLIIPPGKPFDFRPLQNYTSNIANYMAEKFLDAMYLDKIFLHEIKTHPGLISPNEKGYKRLKYLCKEGYKSLSYKQELLRTRRPFYTIKFQEARFSPAMRRRMDAELRKIQGFARTQADYLLKKIEKAIDTKQTYKALVLAEKLKIFCTMKPIKILPTREYYLENMYRLVSYAYYQLYRNNPRHTPNQERRRVKWWFGIPLSKDPSFDSIINQFKDSFIDYKKQTVVFEDRLRKATTSNEMCWLYHELAIYNSEVKNYELGRVYSRKCIQEANKIESIHWIVNAMMQIARINMLQHNKNDTKTQLNEVMKVAVKIADPNLQVFLKTCLEFVEDYESSDYVGSKVLEKREQQILQIMTTQGAEMKSEVAFLFRKMGAMPTTRRMSVMPGVRLDDTNEKLTPALRQMSIMPAPKTDEPQASHKKGKGKDDKKDGPPAGTGFMELIKYHVE